MRIKYINFATTTVYVWGAVFDVKMRRFIMPTLIDSDSIVYSHIYDLDGSEYILFRGEGKKIDGQFIYTITATYVRIEKGHTYAKQFTLIFPEKDLYNRSHYLGNELLYDFALAYPMYHEDNRIDERKAYNINTIRELIKTIEEHTIIDTVGLTVKP